MHVQRETYLALSLHKINRGEYTQVYIYTYYSNNGCQGELSLPLHVNIGFKQERYLRANTTLPMV